MEASARDAPAHGEATIARSLTPASIQPPIDAAAKYREIDRAFPAREMVFPGVA